jgi:hypothetical protein
MINGGISQSIQSSPFSNSESLYNSLRMYSFTDELLCLSQEFRGKDTDRRRPIADFIVLDLADINEDLGSCVIQGDRFEDCRSVVRDGDFSTRRRLQDFILRLGQS